MQELTYIDTLIERTLKPKNMVWNASYRTYHTWLNMKDRCHRQTNTSYHNYGARGISICDRWLEYPNFLEDMGERPEGLTLERIDNNGNYEPNNCRWASRKEQANNTRNTIILEYNGISGRLIDWSVLTGLAPYVLRERLRNGWSVERTLTEKSCLNWILDKLREV